MKALLIGSGAVGIGIAASLCRMGWQLDIVATGATAEALRTDGLRRSGLFGDLHVPADAVRVIPNPDMTEDSVDHILVCTKAMSNEKVAHSLIRLAERLGSRMHITVFQNGWDTEAPFTALFGTARVFNARVITGFSRPQPNESRITVHAAPVLIGSLHGKGTESVAALAEAIHAGGIPCEISQDIGKALWAKMLYNCTLNPLGAVMGLTYGQLAENPHAVSIMDRIIDEVFSVMLASGNNTFWPDAAAYRHAFYETLIPPTRDHRSSTLQDLEKGVRTEIDTLNGAVLRLGAALGVSAPTNRTITDLVKAMEYRAENPQ